MDGTNQQSSIPDWATGKFIPADQVESQPPVQQSPDNGQIPSWAAGKFIPAESIDGPSSSAKTNISASEDIKKQQPTIASQIAGGAAMMLPNILDFGARGGVQGANKIAELATGQNPNVEWPGIMNLPGAAYSMISGKENPIPTMPSTSGELLQKIGDDTGTSQYISREPETTSGKIANVGEQFIGLGALGGFRPSTTGGGGSASESVINALKTVPSSLGAAAASEGANQLGMGPLGQLAGGIVGGVTPHAIAAGATKVGSYLPTVRELSQKQAAVQNIMSNADNPQELAQQAQISTANQNPSGETSPVAPQINQTAAELSPSDQGLANYQQQTLSSAAKLGDPKFVERVQALNEARTQALTNFSQSTRGNGDPSQLGQLFTSHLNAIDEQIRAAEAGHAAIADRLSPGQSLNDAGIQATQGFEQARSEAAQQRDDAYAALDPMRSALVSVGDIPTVARDLSRNAGVRLNKPSDIEENAYTYAKNLPNVNVPFGSLLDLHKDINDTISQVGRQQGFKSEPIQRLYTLKNSIEDSINGAIDSNQSSMRPAIGGWLDGLYNDRQAEAVDAGEQRPTTGNGPTTNSVASPTVFRGDDTSTRSAGGSIGYPAGSSEISPGQQFKEARQANIALKDTYDNPSILSSTFKKEGGEYTKSEASRGAALFKSGTEGGQNISDLKAANVPQESIEDSALNKLRSDNILRGDAHDEARLQKWQTKHESALSQLPELNAKLSDAGKASSALQQQAEKARASRDTLVKSVAGKFLNTEDTDAGIKNIIEGKTPAASSAELMRRIGDDDQGESSVKAATIDFLINKFGDTPKKSKAFDVYVSDNREAITRLTDQKTYNAISRMARAMRSDSESGVGSLGNVKAKEQVKQSLFGKLHELVGSAGEVGIGALGGHLTHLLNPVAAGVGGTIMLLRSIRNAGYKNIKQFERDILMNPGAYPELFNKYAADQEIPAMAQRKLSQKIMSNIPTLASLNSQKIGNQQ